MVSKCAPVKLEEGRSKVFGVVGPVEIDNVLRLWSSSSGEGDGVLGGEIREQFIVSLCHCPAIVSSTFMLVSAVSSWLLFLLLLVCAALQYLNFLLRICVFIRSMMRGGSSRVMLTTIQSASKLADDIPELSNRRRDVNDNAMSSSHCLRLRIIFTFTKIS